MRKRLCPEDVRPAPRARALWRAGLAVTLAVMAGTALVRAQADKGITGQREDRMEQVQTKTENQQKADTEVWTPAKIIINLDARCPVVTALGYFGAFATTDQDPVKAAELQSRYAQLQKAMQPMAEELKKMATTTSFVGTKFPAELTPRLNIMAGELYGLVLKLYGDGGLNELKQYMSTLSQGVVVDQVKSPS